MDDGMVRIPAGGFSMGSEEFYPEEAPVHREEVRAFDLDRHPVTNDQFRAFVEATGYVTVAEQALDAAQFPQLSEADRAPGSLAFRQTEGLVDLRDWRAWWAWVPGADWRHPFGPGSDIDGRGWHPVVQVSFVDALAYAEWAGKRLPTEAEWERAARGGVDGRRFAWGDEATPGGMLQANHWQGAFPYRNTGAAGWRGTSPVGTFPQNPYGLVDMIGNVWEWTSSPFTANHNRAAREANRRESGAETGGEGAPGSVPEGSPSGEASGAGCGCGCSPAAARTPDPSASHVTKGGSHLCAPEYCLRYRPAARSPQTEDSATTHLGFRCARDVAA